VAHWDFGGDWSRIHNDQVTQTRVGASPARKNGRIMAAWCFSAEPFTDEPLICTVKPVFTSRSKCYGGSEQALEHVGVLRWSHIRVRYHQPLSRRAETGQRKDKAIKSYIGPVANGTPFRRHTLEIYHPGSKRRSSLETVPLFTVPEHEERPVKRGLCFRWTGRKMESIRYTTAPG